MCTFVRSVVSCEAGKFSAQTDRSRIVNGKGFSERIPVCQPCPLGTYAQEIGSSTCQSCPKYHSTLTTGASSTSDCIRKFEDSKLFCVVFTFLL